MTCVPTPRIPNVAMNAKARGMPAKFAATPENVVSARADPARRPLADRRVRHQQAEEAAEQRRHEAHLDAVLERRPVRLVEERPDVVERVAAVVRLERTDEDVRGRQQQERRRVGEERHHAEPGERALSSPGPPERAGRGRPV